MKNYTIVHLTKFRDDTIINNGEKKKKTKKTHKGRMKGKVSRSQKGNKLRMLCLLTSFAIILS